MPPAALVDQRMEMEHGQQLPELIQVMADGVETLVVLPAHIAPTDLAVPEAVVQME